MIITLSNSVKYDDFLNNYHTESHVTFETKQIQRTLENFESGHHGDDLSVPSATDTSFDSSMSSLASMGSMESVQKLSSHRPKRRVIFGSYWANRTSHTSKSSQNIHSSRDVTMKSSEMSCNRTNNVVHKLSRQTTTVKSSPPRRNIFGSFAPEEKQIPKQHLPHMKVTVPPRRLSGVRIKSTSSLLLFKQNKEKLGDMKRSVSFDPKVAIYEFDNNMVEQWAGENWTDYFT